jgi:hypothetical protein
MKSSKFSFMDRVRLSCPNEGLPREGTIALLNDTLIVAFDAMNWEWLESIEDKLERIERVWERSR